jgi:hypothetical protein
VDPWAPERGRSFRGALEIIARWEWFLPAPLLSVLGRPPYQAIPIFADFDKPGIDR